MRSRWITHWILGFAVLAMTATSALARPLRFNFTFASGGATAVGFIVFEDTLLANPGANNFALPNPAVLDLQVTVSGATAGNGTFGIGSFSSVIFDTNGATLNFANQLVGQPTPGATWGTPSGTGGDFNLFAAAPAPNGVFFFTLGANGGAANAMVLRAMALGTGATVPALGDWALVILALLLGGIGIVLVQRHTVTART